MNYKVSSQDLSSIKLNESNIVASILQNIAIILSTRQQSIPLYRSFALPMRYIDKPMTVARTMMIAEIQESILQFEPRATVLGVTFDIDESVPGKLIPTVCIR